MSCSSSFAKIILFIFNFCFFLFGAASLGVGIWVLVDKSSLLQLAKVGLPNNTQTQDLNSYLNTPSLLQVGAYVLIAIGSFTFIVGFCGCCGAIKESKCLLYIYAILVTFILLIEIAGAIVVGVYKGKVTSELSTFLTTTVNNQYIGIPSKDDKTVEGIFSLAWNYAQVMFKCCGVNSPYDFINGTTTKWYKSYRSYNLSGTTHTAVIPPTCCKFKDADSLLSSANWWTLPEQMINNRCPIDSTDYYNTGCVDSIQNYFQRYATVLIAVACGIGGLELIGIIAACCLIRSLKEEKY